MTTQYYKTKLETTVIESISNQISFAFLNLLQNSCDFFNGDIGKDFKVENKEILSITDFIIDSTINLQSILSLNESEKEAIINQINSYKRSLILNYETFCTYLHQYNILLIFVEEIYSKKYLSNSSNDINIDDIDFDKFLNDCHEFIESSTNEAEQNYRITQLIKCVPIIMTKQKYFDYIKKSISTKLNTSSKTAISKFIKMLKEYFLPSASPNYYKLFEQLATEIEEYMNLFRSSNTNYELDSTELSTQIDNLNDKLISVSEYLYLLYKELNYLTILLSMRFDLSFIEELNPVYMDLYKTTCMILSNDTSNDEKEIYNESLINLLDNHIDKISESQLKTTSNLEKLIDRYDDRVELEGILNTDYMFKMYINMDLKDSCYSIQNDTNETSDKTYLEDSINEFIEFLNTSLSKINTKEGKRRMQYLLGAVPAIWSPHETLDYIELSLNNCSSKEKKLLAISLVGNLMEENNFFKSNHNHDKCECFHNH